jgi:hypothetical protein
LSRGEKPLDKFPSIAYNIYRSKQEEDKEMAKWNVQVMFTGYVEVEVEADSYEEACEEATVITDTDMVHGWDCDIEDCWCEEDD